jgi:hypothetical protein
LSTGPHRSWMWNRPKPLNNTLASIPALEAQLRQARMPSACCLDCRPRTYPNCSRVTEIPSPRPRWRLIRPTSSGAGRIFGRRGGGYGPGALIGVPKRTSTRRFLSTDLSGFSRAMWEPSSSVTFFNGGAEPSRSVLPSVGTSSIMAGSRTTSGCRAPGQQLLIAYQNAVLKPSRK